VVVDSREKVPILFPETISWHPDRTRTECLIAVKTRKDALFAGDYCLEFPDGTRHDRTCTIERKGSPSEIYSNLFTNDWRRAAKAFERLSRIKSLSPYNGAHYLLIEPSQANLRTFEKEHDLQEGVLTDRILQVAARFGLNIWWAPHHTLPSARRRLGELMIRTMLAHIFHPRLPLDPYSDQWYVQHRTDSRDWGKKGKR
jgi:hypothetical protein